MSQTGGELTLVVGATGPQMQLLMSDLTTVFPARFAAVSFPGMLDVHRIFIFCFAVLMWFI